MKNLWNKACNIAVELEKKGKKIVIEKKKLTEKSDCKEGKRKKANTNKGSRMEIFFLKVADVNE